MTIQAQTPLWTASRKTALAVLLLVQFTAAYAIGSSRWLTNDSASLVPPIGVSALTPVALFLVAYALSMRFRSFVLAHDIRSLTMIQLWRVVGFVFLPLYAFGILPGLFAWPAGLGDVAVGLMALYVVTRIDRDPDYATGPAVVGFHLMGLLDFTVAIATAGMAAGAFPGLIATGITSAPLDVWPMNIFPSFIVPVFVILQLSALLKVRALRTSSRAQVNRSPQIA